MKSTWDQERRKKNGKRLKLVIANLPTGSPSEIKIQNARSILKSAARGERDRKRLRAAALDHAA